MNKMTTTKDTERDLVKLCKELSPQNREVLLDCAVTARHVEAEARDAAQRTLEALPCGGKAERCTPRYRNMG
jgi:hypothetical protein